MRFKTRVLATRTTVFKAQPCRHTIEQVHRFFATKILNVRFIGFSLACILLGPFVAAARRPCFATAQFPPHFVNMTESCDLNANLRNVVSQHWPYTTQTISCVAAFCAIVHRSIVYVMHILRVDSVHRLLSYAVDHNKAVRTDVAAKLVWLGHTRPRSPPAQRN